MISRRRLIASAFPKGFGDLSEAWRFKQSHFGYYGTVCQRVVCAMVPIPSPAVRAYLRSHEAVALVCYASGRISVTRDVGRPSLGPAMAAVWWVASASQALAVQHQCEVQDTGDVVSIAEALGVVLTSHAVAVERASACVAAIDAAMAEAKQNGMLKFFNSSYALLRRRARDEGRTFLSYSTAYDRLRKGVYARTPNRPVVTRSLIAEALGLDGGERRRPAANE